jgi:hypothetical protein
MNKMLNKIFFFEITVLCSSRDGIYKTFICYYGLSWFDTPLYSTGCFAKSKHVTHTHTCIFICRALFRSSSHLMKEKVSFVWGCLCGLVVRVPGYRGPGFDSRLY